MKHHPRSRHPFLENFRHYQVPSLGGDSAPINNPSSDDPKAKNNPQSPGTTVGKGNSPRPTSTVGGGGSGSPSGPNLGGDSRSSDPARPSVGGENTPPTASDPPPNSPSTGSPGTRPTQQRSTTEGGSQKQNRESTYARSSPDLSSRISPEGGGFSRSEVVRLHQDLQILLSRAETPSRPLSSGNASVVISAESSLHGLSSLIAQSLAVINQNPVALIQGALQGSLRNSTGSSGVLAALIRTLGTPPALLKGDVSSSKTPLNVSNLNPSSTGNTWNDTRQNFLGSLQVTLGSVSLLSVLSPNQALLKGFFQEIGLTAVQEKALWNYFLFIGKNMGKIPGSSLPSPEPPGVLKNLMQGLSVMGESFGLRWFQPMLTPLFRALFGGLLFKGEGHFNEIHSALFDELGALMARKMRRFKRKDRKRISRADRVVAKDQSLPIDTQAHEKEGLIFIEEEDTEKDAEDLVSLFW